MDTTIVVPTFNEGGNVSLLVERLAACFDGRRDVEVLFVDDSTDDTPAQIEAVIATSPLQVRLLHRADDDRVGGLAGAVAAGIAASHAEYVVVMDGDLQHPPELVPELRRTMDDVDLVVASRYCGEGDASGLSSSWRRSVSGSSTLLARSCFPRRVGKVCTDPMTGFFCVRRSAVDLGRLQPRGFKILLEILARHDLRVAEVPFVFGQRHAGDSKASWVNGVSFLYQMLSLRMGAMSRFAAVGALGTLVNLAVMALLVHGVFDINYLVAAIVAAEVSILHNFVLQERFVFRDVRNEATSRLLSRLAQHTAFNNVEALVRLPVLALLVEVGGVNPLVAQAATLAVAFLARFFFVTRVIYRPRVVHALVAPATVGEALEDAS